jgi:hypothetical protein
MIHSSLITTGVRQSSAGCLTALRQNGSDIAGFPLDSAALAQVSAQGD